ncbi:MAG: hypothetical protein GY855_10885, partial [candidate division Zixibacteria bacterium]|nr:hypothetical protein [candidate division Zixibacteria bacterium]
MFRKHLIFFIVLKFCISLFIAGLGNTAEFEYPYKLSTFRLNNFDINYAGNSSPDKKNETQQKGGVFHDIKDATGTLINDGLYIYSSPSRINKRSALILGGVITIGTVLYAYDKEIWEEMRTWPDRNHYEPINDVAEEIEWIGHMGKTNRYYFGGLAVGYVLKIKPLTLISAQILESHFIAGGVKNLAILAVGRRRPHEGGDARKFWDSGTSFPSGHGSNIFQVATILSHHVNFFPATITFYGLATSVA